MINTLIIYENFKELKELYEIAISISHKITIISPSKLYGDEQALVFLEKINKQSKIKVEYLEYKNVEFPKISILRKFFISNRIKKRIQKLDLNSFDLVLSGVQTIFSRILYKVSRKQGIPFFVYHRHLIFPSLFNSKRKFFSNRVFKQLIYLFKLEEFFVEIPNAGFADKYFVLGKINKDYLTFSGVDEKNILVTGSLEYDFLVNNNLQCDTMDNSLSIVFVTSAFEWIKEYKKEKEQQKRIEDLIALVENNPNVNLTIKVHPRENYEKYLLLKKRFPFVNVDFPKNISIIEDLCKYDLIIGWLSTAIFEVSLLDKKILFCLEEYELKEYNYILKYIPKEAVVTTIPKKVTDLIENSKNIDVSDFIFFRKDERALDRVVRFIKKELGIE